MLLIALWLPLVWRPVQVPRLRRGPQEAATEAIVLCGRRMFLLLGLGRLVRRRVGSDMTGPAGASLDVHAVVAVLAEEGYILARWGVTKLPTSVAKSRDIFEQLVATLSVAC